MSLAESLRRGLLALSSLLPAEGAFSNIYLKDRGAIRFLAHATRERAEMLEDTVPVSPALLALRRYRPDDCYVVDDIADDPFSLAVAPRVIREIRSFVLIRLRLDDRDLGIVSFYSRRPRRLRPSTPGFSRSSGTFWRSKWLCAHAPSSETKRRTRRHEPDASRNARSRPRGSLENASRHDALLSAFGGRHQAGGAL